MTRRLASTTLVAGVAAAALAVAAARIGWRFDTDMQRARALSTQGGTLMDTRCGPIEAQQAGAGVPRLGLPLPGGDPRGA